MSKGGKGGQLAGRFVYNQDPNSVTIAISTNDVIIYIL